MVGLSILNMAVHYSHVYRHGFPLEKVFFDSMFIIQVNKF